MIGMLSENKIGTSKKDNIKLHNSIVIFNETTGFFYAEKTLKLYNTMTHLLKNSKLNSDILDKFIEINYCMNLICNLKINNYNYFIDNLEEYYKKHDNLKSLWNNIHTNYNDIFEYHIFDMEELSYDEFIKSFDKICDKESSVENSIYYNESESGLRVIISNDILKKYERKMYMFIENNKNDLNSDIAYSFRRFTSQVSKIDFSYDSDYKLASLEMTSLGFNSEHIHALNILMKAYNYLINSISFKENNMFIFDELTINKRISNAKLMVERVPLIIQSRLELE